MYNDKEATMKTIAFFNNKGGVGTLCHIEPSSEGTFKLD